MNKVDTIYSWVNENLGKVHFTKEQKIKRVGMSVNKTTKNGEVTEDSILSFTLDGDNIISLKDKWIDKIAIEKNKQSMVILLTDELPLTLRDIFEGVLILSNDPSLYDELPKDPSFYETFYEEEEEVKEIDEKSDMDEKWDTMVSNIGKAAEFAAENGTSVGEALHQLFNKEEKEEKEWPSKDVIEVSGDTFTAPIVRINGNTIVQNYIKNNSKHGNLGIVYFNEKYGFGGNGDFEVHEKESLQHRSERFVIVTEGDKQYEEAPCLVLDENEEVRVLTPTWAVESGKPSILCAKGTDNDRFIIYPLIDYPTPFMGILVETEKQFDNLFNFKPLGGVVDDKACVNLHNVVMNALSDGARKAKSGECKFYDGEKDTRELVNKNEAERYEKTMSINTDKMRANLKGLVGNFVDATTSKIEKDGCAAKNFKDVNQMTIPLSKIKVINLDDADEKTKELVKELIQEQDNFSRKVYGDEAVDATLKCLNKCGSDKLNTLVADLIKDKKILLGEEEADEKDKEEIAESIANGSGCLEDEDDLLFKKMAEYVQRHRASSVSFYLETDGSVSSEVRLSYTYPSNKK